jgi:hypothetical protein
MTKEGLWQVSCIRSSGNRFRAPIPKLFEDPVTIVPQQPTGTSNAPVAECAARICAH